MVKIIIISLAALISSSGFARSIFLNGKDISSAKGEKLDNVSVFVSENGDVFITAPQYQVHEEKTFVPLSSRSNPGQVARSTAETSHPEGLPSAASVLSGSQPMSDLDTDSSETPIESEINTELLKKSGTRTLD